MIAPARLQEFTVQVTPFTCAWCQQTYTGPITYRGAEESESAALMAVTGQKGKNGRKGPHCPTCLDQWMSHERKERFSRLIQAAQKAQTGDGFGLICDQHERMFVRSDGAWQPMEAGRTWPNRDGWRNRQK